MLMFSLTVQEIYDIAIDSTFISKIMADLSTTQVSSLGSHIIFRQLPDESHMLYQVLPKN